MAPESLSDIAVISSWLRLEPACVACAEDEPEEAEEGDDEGAVAVQIAQDEVDEAEDDEPLSGSVVISVWKYAECSSNTDRWTWNVWSS